MANVTYPPERVYSLIPVEEVKPQKPPRYISKFRPTVVEEKKLNKHPMRTLGPAKEDVPSPEKYLIKHSKEPKLGDNESGCPHLRSRSCTVKKPAVPLRTDKPVMGVHTKKDFVKTNALENIMAVPRRPEPAFSDTERGKTQLLENSGLVPKYLKKKDFGETPEYLKQRMEETRRAQEEYANHVRERMKQGAMKQISEEERQATLEGLKTTLNELHHQFQGLSVVTDTISKKYRKERLEHAMRQLEKDINYLERYKTIYLAHN